MEYLWSLKGLLPQQKKELGLGAIEVAFPRSPLRGSDRTHTYAIVCKYSMALISLPSQEVFVNLLRFSTLEWEKLCRKEPQKAIPKV